MKYTIVMKSKSKKYLVPRVRDAHLELEGILCGSLKPNPDVDELHNMSETPERSYFEL